MDVKCAFLSLLLLLAVCLGFFHTLTLALPHLFNWFCDFAVP